MLRPGLKDRRLFRVTDQHSAKFLGSGDVSVLSTPSMITFMEETCRKMVESFLEEGDTTVGTRVDVSHLKPAPVGEEVEVTAELIEVDGRRLKFRVEAFWRGEKIGEGYHERFVVNRERFLSKLRELKN
ncbi:MAG: thioesterase [Thermoproteota archaeon]|jgi:predicted thioesterase|uniref:Thioesterase n=1 Tax=Candidatus Methanodesulfokora washburnensis TaxID=2478471 RepID=A0A3R9RMI2_9CREN|nr:thioesterase family protein [Candidatus Methanodesulfokores washburnensis]RSN73816.1 thioesterase [Candidatus Methanodesulfokores washburnensis]RZN61294.1 MAG: thioesterase [Candidatus Methanodesulfokores washburnensis]TDA40910.1 MAG: thioesterase [Candidatus Korarchaeota archaeon]